MKEMTCVICFKKYPKAAMKHKRRSICSDFCMNIVRERLNALKKIRGAE